MDKEILEAENVEINESENAKKSLDEKACKIKLGFKKHWKKIAVGAGIAINSAIVIGGLICCKSLMRALANDASDNFVIIDEDDSIECKNVEIVDMENEIETELETETA